MSMQTALWLAMLAGVVAIVYGIFMSRWILAQPAGNARMQEIAAAIQAGAKAYLNRQYSTIAIVGVVLFVALGFALDWYTAVGFAFGALLSGMVIVSPRERSATVTFHTSSPVFASTATVRPSSRL